MNGQIKGLAAGIFKPFKGSDLTVVALGRPVDYSLSMKGSHAAENREMALDALATVSAELGITGDILIPDSSSCNQKLEQGSRFKTHLEHKGCRIATGVEADAVVLPEGGAILHRVADCPVMVVETDNGMVVAAHAGRESLWNRASVLEGIASSHPASIVDSVVEHLTIGRIGLNMRVFLVAGIEPERFDHPWNHDEHGAANEIMTLHFMNSFGTDCVSGEDKKIGCLDLYRIITSQIGRQSGLGQVQIRTDRGENFERARLYSHRGEVIDGERHRDTERHGILICRSNN